MSAMARAKRSASVAETTLVSLTGATAPFRLFVGGKPLLEEIELGQPLPVGDVQPLSIGDINEQESEDRNEKQKFHAHPKRKALAEMSETSQLPVFPGRPCNA